MRTDTPASSQTKGGTGKGVEARLLCVFACTVYETKKRVPYSGCEQGFCRRMVTLYVLARLPFISIFHNIFKNYRIFLHSDCWSSSPPSSVYTVYTSTQIYGPTVCGLSGCVLHRPCQEMKKWNLIYAVFCKDILVSLFLYIKSPHVCPSFLPDVQKSTNSTKCC